VGEIYIRSFNTVEVVPNLLQLETIPSLFVYSALLVQASFITIRLFLPKHGTSPLHGPKKIPVVFSVEFEKFCLCFVKLRKFFQTFQKCRIH